MSMRDNRIFNVIHSSDIHLPPSSAQTILALTKSAVNPKLSWTTSKESSPERSRKHVVMALWLDVTVAWSQVFGTSHKLLKITVVRVDRETKVTQSSRNKIIAKKKFNNDPPGGQLSSIFRRRESSLSSHYDHTRNVHLNTQSCSSRTYRFYCHE